MDDSRCFGCLHSSFVTKHLESNEVTINCNCDDLSCELHPSKLGMPKKVYKTYGVMKPPDWDDFQRWLSKVRGS